MAFLLLGYNCNLDFKVSFNLTKLYGELSLLQVIRVVVVNNYQYFVRLNKHVTFSLLYTRKTIGGNL
jgi:hypothetical protein